MQAPSKPSTRASTDLQLDEVEEDPAGDEDNDHPLSLSTPDTDTPGSSGPSPSRRLQRKSSFVVARDKPRSRTRSNSGGGQDRLFLFSSKGDVDALSSEQLVQVLVSRGVAFDETSIQSKKNLKEMVHLTTPTASPIKAICKSEKKLLILDINGLLLDRAVYETRGQPGHELMKRPFLDEFLNLIFNELNFDVTVWTAGFIMRSLLFRP